MNTQSLNNLFSEMLNNQIETGINSTIDATKLQLLAENGLTKKDKKTLLRSPIARYSYLDAKNKHKQNLLQQIKQNHIETEVMPLAASSASEDTLVFSCASYRITIYHNKLSDKPWIILMQLKPDLMKIIGKNTIVRLVDTSGKEWAKGKPDDNGELLVSQENNINFFEQAKKYSLNLEIV